MADLTTDFVGIKSPNPFWLASAPPTDKEYNVRRAFDAGWGGVVWKTLGEDGPPIVNVNGPRYGAIWGADRRLLGLNNIELITDRPLDVNLREIKAVKRDYPDRAMVVSLMVPCEEAAWKAILPLVEETGAEVRDLQTEEEVQIKVPDGAALHEVKTYSTIYNCDVLISVPRLKRHSSATVTISLKNMMGTLPKHEMGRLLKIESKLF